MSAQALPYQPGAILHDAVVGAFKARGLSFEAWWSSTPAGRSGNREPNLSQGPQATEFTLQLPGGQSLRVMDTLMDNRVKHREYRDDRFVAAVKLDAAPMNLVYMVRVVTPGRYSVPGTFVEDMYRPELRIVGERGAPLDVVDSVAGRR